MPECDSISLLCDLRYRYIAVRPDINKYLQNI